MPSVVARVYIVRHGETDYNRQGIVQGQIDTPLNEAGVEQARLAADALEDTPFEVAYSSDLQRARRVSALQYSRSLCCTASGGGMPLLSVYK